MAKINAINNKSGELTLDPGASGDSFVQFDINGTGEFRIGVDDDDSDKFKISQGSALGTNDTFVVTAAGEVVRPLTTAFCAYNNVTDNNVTGDGTVYSVALDSERFDQNDDFATPTFTAPVTGRYLLMGVTNFSDIGAAHTTGYLYIDTSNRDYLGNNVSPYAIMFQGGNDRLSIHCNVLADMDASDTAVLKLVVSGGGKDIEVNSSANVFTGFSGYLVC